MPSALKAEKMPKTSKPKIGAPRKYPWDAWLKPGSKHLLERGKDFRCSIRSMIVYLYQRASKENRHVSINEAGANKLNIEVSR